MKFHSKILQHIIQCNIVALSHYFPIYWPYIQLPQLTAPNIYVFVGFFFKSGSYHRPYTISICYIQGSYKLKQCSSLCFLLSVCEDIRLSYSMILTPVYLNFIVTTVLGVESGEHHLMGGAGSLHEILWFSFVFSFNIDVNVTLSQNRIVTYLLHNSLYYLFSFTIKFLRFS